MDKYDFKLTPAYCIWNGVAIFKQSRTYICFMLTNPDNTAFCEKLKTAFINHLSQILLQPGCPDFYRAPPKIDFIYGSKNDIRKLIQKQTDSLINDGLILFDELISTAVEQKISEIHIYNNQIFFKPDYKELENSFAEKYSESETAKIIQRINELSNITESSSFTCHNRYFLYGKNDSLYIEISILPFFDKQRCSKDFCYMLRLLDTTELPVSTEELGFTDVQLSRLNLTEKQTTDFTAICELNPHIRHKILSSLIYETLKSNSTNLKIISIEESPEYFIPGVIYADKRSIHQKDELEFYQNIFRQNPDMIVVGDIYEKRHFLFCLNALKRGISIITTIPVKDADFFLADLDFFSIPQKELLSFPCNFIALEKNPEHQNHKILIDLCTSTPKTPQDNTSETNQNANFVHYTNYSQILAENMEMIFERKKNKEKLLPRKGLHPLVTVNKSGEKANEA